MTIYYTAACSKHFYLCDIITKICSHSSVKCWFCYKSVLPYHTQSLPVLLGSVHHINKYIISFVIKNGIHFHKLAERDLRQHEISCVVYCSCVWDMVDLTSAFIYLNASHFYTWMLYLYTRFYDVPMRFYCCMNFPESRTMFSNTLSDEDELFCTIDNSNLGDILT